MILPRAQAMGSSTVVARRGLSHRSKKISMDTTARDDRPS
jgi:hypothetical protein